MTSIHCASAIYKAQLSTDMNAGSDKLLAINLATSQEEMALSPVLRICDKTILRVAQIWF
jgi:hypothetical protein